MMRFGHCLGSKCGEHDVQNDKILEDSEPLRKRGKGKVWVEEEVFKTEQAWLDYEKYIISPEFQKGNGHKGKKSCYQVYFCKFKRKAGYVGCEFDLRAVNNADIDGVILEKYENIEHNHSEISKDFDAGSTYSPAFPEKFKWTSETIKIVKEGLANDLTATQIFLKMEEAKLRQTPKIRQLQRKMECLRRRMTK